MKGTIKCRIVDNNFKEFLKGIKRFLEELGLEVTGDFDGVHAVQPSFRESLIQMEAEGLVAILEEPKFWN